MMAGRVTEGRIADSTKQRCVVSDKGNGIRFVSHCLMCKMHGYREVPDYSTLYLSVPSHVALRIHHQLTFRGNLPSFIGRKFGHIQIPPSLRLIQKIMPPDNTYLGFDSMGSDLYPFDTFTWASFINLVQGIHGLLTPEDWQNGN